VEFDDSVSTAQAQAAGLGGGNTSSGFSSDLGSGDSAEDFNSFVVGSNPKEIAAGGLGGFDVYTMVRGATADNPYPESFFSKMFGANNVNYAKSMGRDRVREINQLRYRQATGQLSEKTGEQYKMGDYYIGQDTNMGTVKEVPQTGIMSVMNNLPYIGAISSVMGRNRGLPENDPRRIAMMEEQAKSANDPTVFDRTSDFVKSILGLDPKDSGASLAASPIGEGQMRSPDTRTFDAFGNVRGSALDTKDNFGINSLDVDKSKEADMQVADASQFNFLRSATDTVKPQINKFLQDNINKNLQFENDYRPDPSDPNRMMPYMGFKLTI